MSPRRNSRFHVFTNLAISIDGKISTRERELFALGSARDHFYMDVHRARAHAVLMGAGTLRSFQNPVSVQRKQLQLKRRNQGLGLHPINIVLASKLDFDISWPFFTDPSIERVLVIPETVSERKTRPYRHLAHIFHYRDPKNFPREIVAYLGEKHGCRNLLLEGGGGTIFPFASLDLVDEWNVTVTPKIVGGEAAPTMVDGEGFLADEIKEYRLKSLKRYKSELFLQYVRP